MDVMFTLFQVAGVAMVAHVVLSQVLRFMVGWKSSVALELFAVPNAPLVPDLGVRLLNAKYFLPWVPSPIAMHSQPFFTRLIFWLTRITGPLFPLAMLSIFVGAFVIATR
jgi:hypothetical protein